MVRNFTAQEITEIETLIGEIANLQVDLSTKRAELDQLYVTRTSLVSKLVNIKQMVIPNSAEEISQADLDIRQAFIDDFKIFGSVVFIIDIFASENHKQFVEHELVQKTLQAKIDERDAIQTQIQTKEERIEELQDLIIYG